MTTSSPVWADTAGRALAYAIEQQHQRAHDHLQRIADQHGHEVIPDVLLAWIDTTLHHCPPPEGATTVAPLWQAEGTSTVHTADEVPPPARWAGRLFAARINNDRDQWIALIRAAATDDEWSEQVAAVLYMCSALLRHQQSEQEATS